MKLRSEFENLLSILSTEREKLQLKLKLASMEVRDEFGEAEKQWQEIKLKAEEIADDTIETSDEYIAKAKVVGDELKETYQRIAQRLSS